MCAGDGSKWPVSLACLISANWKWRLASSNAGHAICEGQRWNLVQIILVAEREDSWTAWHCDARLSWVSPGYSSPVDPPDFVVSVRKASCSPAVRRDKSAKREPHTVPP